MNTQDTIKTIVESMGENEVLTTREFSAQAGIPMKATYSALSALCEAGMLSRYGYRVKGGWEAPESTTRKCDSLGWQKN